jgi:large subunit ribosomal protein L22
MEVTVKAKYIKISPRKIILTANLIQGLTLDNAKAQLKYLNKESGKKVYEILKSAAAAAKEKDINLDNCFVKSVICNQGPALKRRRMVERGKATSIRKRTSHIYLTLAEKEVKKVNLTKKGIKNGTKSQSK